MHHATQHDRFKGSFHFLQNLPEYQTEKPYEIWRESPEHIPKSNCKFEERHGIILRNIRECDPRDFDYATTGFKPLYSPCIEPLSSEDCTSLEPTGRLLRYLENTIELVKSQLKAKEVICFDWRYRMSSGVKQINVYDYTKQERYNSLNPAHVVHFDDSPDGGMGRLQRYLKPEELASFKNDEIRIRFVNVWRPLVAVVEDSPLAMCDRQSVSVSDMFECDKIHEDHIGEGLYLIHNEEQRWYWLPDMTSDEALVFVTWDSQFDEKHPVGPPHAACDDPKPRTSPSPRESIEVRLMVFTEK
ncbi:hypothetical protein M438DRAFT_360323 [Aureobasidium pullulans EXF-150]|uniref:Methyltransferase n=3 Tax=Aureobasidium pullulans TaxID=5580 RepID=A0A074X4H6_AURPU|nr:uncharacterized protein M438DRAFT_360323 [Aureobasidium pullulans EXF-150]KEQ78639.1 hypothetical protein M438DRAFT_360323 [Aureobasidium pullulans EXF-150]THX37221.1 hypothetical protein D6D10_06037 [Aureobasidium pullulans]